MFVSLTEQEAIAKEYLASWRRGLYYPVATVAELDARREDENGNEPPFSFDLLNEHLIAWRRADGQVTVMQGNCPHLTVDLGIGWINKERDAVTCRWHGFDFGWKDCQFDGQCRVQRMPFMESDGKPRGQVPTGKNWNAQTYPTQEAWGLVWASLDPNPTFPVLEVPQMSDPRYVGCDIYTMEWAAGVGWIMVAALDRYHFAFTHIKSGLGNPSNPKLAPADIWVEDNCLRMVYTIPQPVNATISVANSPTHEQFEDVLYEMWYRPNAVYLLKTSNVGHYVIAGANQPLGFLATERGLVPRTRAFFLEFRDFDIDPANNGRYAEFNKIAYAEDRLVVESLRPHQLTPNYREHHLTYADDAARAYLEWLTQLGYTYA